MIALTDSKIDTEAILSDVEDSASGAVVLFLGRVRDHSEGMQISAMDYEAYSDMAVAKLKAIQDETKFKWPVSRMVMVHRTGRLAVGEVSVAIAVACPHRKDAFEACRYAIDTIKKTVPIWKKEYTDGGESWVKGVIPTAETE